MDEVATLKIPYDLTHMPLEIPYDPILIPATSYPITLLIIIMPSTFSFESTKVVPCNYESTFYIYGHKVEKELMESKETSVNFVGASGINRSGRLFTSVPPPDNNNHGSSSKNHGK